MMVLALVLGLVLRRRLANFNLLFNREIASTDLLIGEKVQVVGSGYRLSDVIHALQNRGEYREDLERRARPFTEHYPLMLRGTLLVGVAGLAVIGVIAWLLPGGKAPLLGVWVLWCLLIMGFLVVIEYVKKSFGHAREIASLDDGELRDAMLTERSSLHAWPDSEPALAAATAGSASAGPEQNVTASGESERSAAAYRGDDNLDELMADWFGAPPSAGEADEHNPDDTTTDDTEAHEGGPRA